VPEGAGEGAFAVPFSLWEKVPEGRMRARPLRGREAVAFDFAFNCFCCYVRFSGFGCTLTPTPLPEGEGLKPMPTTGEREPTMTELRIALLTAGLLLMLAIWYFSRRSRKPDQRPSRRAPSLHGVPGEPAATTPGEQSEPAPPNESPPPLGQRPHHDFDKIITLYVTARPGQVLRGTDILVAAEKTGLTYGHQDIFHRLPTTSPERGPIFSVANLQAPNSFPMADIQTLETTALVFFLTLPAPVGALDAWDAMLPCAQRMAELLDALVLDEHHSALTRQRIAGLRDDLRAFDRAHTDNGRLDRG